ETSIQEFFQNPNSLRPQDPHPSSLIPHPRFSSGQAPHPSSLGTNIVHLIQTSAMKSKANIGGHPIHPILVAFPIAFFSGAFIFDLLRIFGLDELGRTVEYLIIAGIIGALLAAVPGIIDFFFTVPPKSSGKKRAAKHGIINVTVLLLFAATLFYRRNTDFPSDAVIILMESVAIILLVWAGWMGGTLVYRNQIGVNPRYANAGKWKEVRAEIS